MTEQEIIAAMNAIYNTEAHDDAEAAAQDAELERLGGLLTELDFADPDDIYTQQVRDDYRAMKGY